MNICRSKKALSTVLIVLIVVVAVVAVGATGFYIWYSQNQPKSQTLSYTNFNAIDVSAAFKVTVTQSDTYSVVISANQKTFDQIQVTQNGDILKITCLPNTIISLFSPEATITMPKLNNITISGASSGTIKGFDKNEPFTAIVSGASSLDLTNMKTGNVTVDVSGASKLTASGIANDLTATVSGASNLNLQNLAVNNTNINVNGASHADIYVNGKLDADVTGASSLTYSGNPTLGNTNTSGESTINKR